MTDGSAMKHTGGRRNHPTQKQRNTEIELNGAYPTTKRNLAREVHRQAVNILSHYSKCPGRVFRSDYPTPPDNDHKPGGLWLSDDSEYGWCELVHGLVGRGSSGWEDGNELQQYRYDFIIDPPQLDQVLVLSDVQAGRL